MITQKEIEEMENDYIKAYEEEVEKDRLLKLHWRKKLKGLINVSGLFNNLSEMDCWHPIDIVEVYETNEKSGGYQSYQYVRIKDDSDKLLYMRQEDTEIRGVKHNCVWQTVGMMGDDYSGYVLFPLKNGKYFKVSYSC